MESVLSTAVNLVFVPDSRGTLHAYNAETGGEVWNHGNGLGHQGGIVSYAVNGKQYVAVVAGFGGMVRDDFAPTFGEPYKSMPRDDGILVVYSLK
jgi:alcohol dehydrogenase (cytochrome c)